MNYPQLAYPHFPQSNQCTGTKRMSNIQKKILK